MIDRDELLELVREGASGSRFRDVCERVAARCHDAGDEGLAAEIRRAFGDQGELPLGLGPLRIVKPLEEIALAEKVARVVTEFLDEQARTQDLLEAGLKPRNKLLMSGPPGNGKTVLAGALAQKLGYRSFMVRYDALISEEPGATSRGLKQVFDYAAAEPTVLFMDEFDALGVKRTSPKEEGDMKRVVSMLLFQLDNLPHHVVCMAATNHPELLDPAIWRRFNMRMELDRPPVSEFVKFMRERLARYGHHPKEGVNPGEVDFRLADARMQLENLSDAELFCDNVVRHHVMTGRRHTIEECIVEMFERWPEDQKRRSG